MAGYLDQYGAGEEERNRFVALSFVALIVLAVLGALGWYVFQYHHEESIVKAFINGTRRGDYPAAYKAWGCTSQQPCSGYSLQNFTDDWGPKSSSAPDPAVFGITADESCNNGVLFTVAVNSKRQEKLWVNQGSEQINFAPYVNCPRKNPYAIMLDRTLGWLKKPLLK